MFTFGVSRPVDSIPLNKWEYFNLDMVTKPLDRHRGDRKALMSFVLITVAEHNFGRDMKIYWAQIYITT